MECGCNACNRSEGSCRGYARFTPQSFASFRSGTISGASMVVCLGFACSLGGLGDWGPHVGADGRAGGRLLACPKTDFFPSAFCQ